MKIKPILDPSVLGGFNAHTRQALLSMERDYLSSKDENEQQSILNSIFYFIEFQSYLNRDIFKDFSDEQNIEPNGGEQQNVADKLRDNPGEPMA